MVEVPITHDVNSIRFEPQPALYLKSLSIIDPRCVVELRAGWKAGVQITPTGAYVMCDRYLGLQRKASGLTVAHISRLDLVQAVREHVQTLVLCRVFVILGLTLVRSTKGGRRLHSHGHWVDDRPESQETDEDHFRE